QSLASTRAATRDGFAALLGDRVPRRRLPLRPWRDARSRRLRLRPRLRLLRCDPAGSCALAGEADLRAVGSRARWLPARRASAALRRMERPLPRRSAALLAR